MRAAVIQAGGSFEITDVPEPRPGGGELLIRVDACGLCGSDVKARDAMPAGTIMGHEFGGEVVEVGSGVSGFALGTRIAVLPVAPCGSCTWCQSGYVIHCPHARLIGLGQLGGGFAELAVVSAIGAFPMPAGIDPLHSALVEPYAVGLHSVRTGGLQPGDDVLVIGAGSVGLTSIAWARSLGANRVSAVDPTGVRRETATAVGASDVMTSIDEVEPDSYDLVIECVGKPGLLDQAIAATRPRSRVAVVGVCFEPDTLSSIVALMKEVSVRFAVYYTPEEFRTVIDAFASGQVDPTRLLSSSADLATINSAFERFAADPAPGKVLLTPCGSQDSAM